MDIASHHMTHTLGISQRYDVISQRYDVISQRYDVISQRYDVILTYQVGYN